MANALGLQPRDFMGSNPIASTNILLAKQR